MFALDCLFDWDWLDIDALIGIEVGCLDAEFDDRFVGMSFGVDLCDIDHQIRTFGFL